MHKSKLSVISSEYDLIIYKNKISFSIKLNEKEVKDLNVLQKGGARMTQGACLLTASFTNILVKRILEKCAENLSPDISTEDQITILEEFLTNFQKSFAYGIKTALDNQLNEDGSFIKKDDENENNKRKSH